MLNIKKYTKKQYIDFLKRKIKNILPNLEDKGERVDIRADRSDFLLNQNDKCHISRYEFAASILNNDKIVGDFACGTGYGSVYLSKNALEVFGIDLNKKVIDRISKKYENIKNIKFINKNLLDIKYENFFDCIVSFETIEHLKEPEINELLKLFNKALKNNGYIVFSTPYMQEMSDIALKMGFHQTFLINEQKISGWLNKAGFGKELFKYQNYDLCKVEDTVKKKDFIIVIAQKLSLEKTMLIV